jgi:hypothetical protein
MFLVLQCLIFPRRSFTQEEGWKAGNHVAFGAPRRLEVRSPEPIVVASRFTCFVHSGYLSELRRVEIFQYLRPTVVIKFISWIFTIIMASKVRIHSYQVLGSDEGVVRTNTLDVSHLVSIQCWLLEWPSGENETYYGLTSRVKDSIFEGDT